MKHVILCCLIALWSPAIGQLPAQKTIEGSSIKVLDIKPSATDPTIQAANTPHQVLYNPSIKQGKLLLFMPGTNGIATKGPRKFFETAIEQGYQVINLSYINFPAGSTTLVGKVLDEDPDCFEKFRIKRIYGQDTTPLFPDQPQDAIIHRFTKLLIHLAKTDQEGHWDRYLKNGVPYWERIALAGQSQGGGMAAFIAKRTMVARVISFSGGWDRSSRKDIAKWYFGSSVTPADRWYGVYHVNEPTANILLASYTAMAIPKGHIYSLDLPVKQGRQAHGEGISNIAYEPQWKEMLGKGN